MYANTKIAENYQQFFNFINQEHNLTLTISEIDKIVKEAQKLVKNYANTRIAEYYAENYQQFFNFINQQHDLILTISEIDEIVKEAQKLNSKA